MGTAAWTPNATAALLATIATVAAVHGTGRYGHHKRVSNKGPQLGSRDLANFWISKSYQRNVKKYAEHHLYLLACND